MELLKGINMNLIEKYQNHIILHKIDSFKNKLMKINHYRNNQQILSRIIDFLKYKNQKQKNKVTKQRYLD